MSKITFEYEIDTEDIARNILDDLETTLEIQIFNYCIDYYDLRIDYLTIHKEQMNILKKDVINHLINKILSLRNKED